MKPERINVGARCPRLEDKMRKQKTVKIDDREITVKELRVKDVRQLLEMSEVNEDDIMSLLDRFLPVVTDIKSEDLEAMAPSELKVLWETFKEVNADFLEVTGHLGIGKMLGSLIRAHFSEAFADSLSAVTKTPGNTDTPFLSLRSTKVPGSRMKE